MERLIFWTAILIGPVYLALFAGVYLTRRFFPEERILFELTEPILVVTAAVLALAAAGVFAQIV